MRYKLNLIANAISMLFCAVAICVGVYSLSNTTLNISGSLGYVKNDNTFYIKSIEEIFYSNKNDDSTEYKLTTNKLCTTMGHSILDNDGDGSTAGTDGKVETPMQWIAFAVKGESLGNDNYIYNNKWNDSSAPQSERWYSLYGVDMSQKSYKGKTFWFIQQYVVAGGYKLKESDSTYQLGIIFDSINNTYAQIDNGVKSNIYKFLENSYAEQTGMTSDELGRIDMREVNEKYTVNFSGSEYNVVTENGVNTLACQFKSNFWLINHSELGLICNNEIQSTSLDCIGYVYKAFGINNQVGVTDSNNKITGATWALRPPFTEYSGGIRVVYSSGEYYYNDMNFSNNPQLSYGIRAACQITISI